MVDIFLVNDAEHTFDEVVVALMVVLGFSMEQSEQCAILAHYNNEYKIQESVKLTSALKIAVMFESLGLNIVLKTKVEQ